MTSQELIRAVEQANSAYSLFNAVKALAAAREESAIPTLITVLGYNNPGAAVAAVEGLVELGEVAVPSLLEQIDGYNYGARAWSIRALAKIGDPRALDTLLAAANDDFALSVRRAAAQGLGTIHWSKLPDSQIWSAQTQAINTLLKVSQDQEWVVRYAAIVGLQALASTVAGGETDYSSLVQQILEQLQQRAELDPDLVVRARIELALTQLEEIFSQKAIAP